MNTVDPTVFRPLVVCADIGSMAKGNFGWWSSEGESGGSPSSLASLVARGLTSQIPIALGFECPLFLPLEEDEMRLTRARPGEGSRPWSAGAGCGALATGLVQVAWVLQAIRCQATGLPTAHLSWDQFQSSQSGLFLWEAFVSGSAKQMSHTADAKAGVEAFLGALPNLQAANAVVCLSSVYSLVGAALLRTGWSNDLDVLHQPCVVIRAAAPVQ